MLEYILKNREWIFSGVGVSLLTILFSFWQKNKKRSQEHSTKDHSIQNPTFLDSFVNSFSSQNVQIHQTLVQKDVHDKGSEPISDESIKVAGYPELTKAKNQYFTIKKRQRTAIYQAIIKRIKEYPNQPIEIRHILDDAEEEINAQTKDIVKELQEMREEDIIVFLLQTNDLAIGPYTKIELTKKFYSTIDDMKK